MPQYHFFIGNNLIGSSPVDTTRESPAFHIPVESLAFFCESCGEIFARVTVTPQPATTRKWRVLCCCCGNCDSNSAFTVPGSIWLGWNLGYTLSLPRSVLLREFELHLKHSKLLEILND